MKIEINKNTVFASEGGNEFNQEKHTLILIHGSGMSHIVWSLTEQFLSNNGFNILSIDLPGHGNSKGSCLRSIEETAEWLDKVINKIGIKDLSILGHSQGCLVALEYNYKYPKKVKNLIFIGGSYEIPVNKELIDLAKSGSMKALNLMMKWGYGDSKRFIGGNPVQKIINSSREVSSILAIDLIACNNYKNGNKAAKAVNCRTLFILGEIDKMITIAKGKEFSSLVQNSKTHIIKNCGHMIMFENAFEMREEVIKFLKE